MELLTLFHVRGSVMSSFGRLTSVPQGGGAHSTVESGRLYVRCDFLTIHFCGF